MLIFPTLLLRIISSVDTKLVRFTDSAAVHMWRPVV